MTWEVFGEASRTLAQIVADDGYEPDMVLAIARGGLLIGGALGYALAVKNVYTMNVSRFPESSLQLLISSTWRTRGFSLRTMSPTPDTLFEVSSSSVKAKLAKFVPRFCTRSRTRSFERTTRGRRLTCGSISLGATRNPLSIAPVCETPDRFKCCVVKVEARRCLSRF